MDLQRTNDLATLSTFDENVLNSAIRDRYRQDVIYTYVGDILLAVNPFKTLPIYDESVSRKYFHAPPKQLDPHLYAVADRAFDNLVSTQIDQVCVISGESGAGKTESTKIFIRHIIDVSTSDLDRKTHNPIEEKILLMNPLLEAFGNAQTNMNDNSSRFGKYIELKLTPAGVVVGSNLSHYLLEKSRVITQAPGEANFHIFGSFLKYMTDAQRQQFQLPAQSRYRYICNPIVSDYDTWVELVRSLGVVGFTTAEIESIFAVIAGILHLGNIEFDPRSDYATVVNRNILQVASRVLLVESNLLNLAVTTYEIMARGETIVQQLSPEKAQQTIDAASKALYGRLFSWLVHHLDAMLAPKETTCVTIGILDIFGFENFNINSFEQFCINLANEQLQFFFNMHIFSLELAEYNEEGIDPLNISYKDNKPVLEMIYKAPIGLLSLLDEESRFPQATPQSLVDKLNKNFHSQANYSLVNGGGRFAISHYAGNVVYSSELFLEKNRDFLSDQVLRTFSSSSNEFIQALFADEHKFAAPSTDANLLQFLNLDHRRKIKPRHAAEPRTLKRKKGKDERKSGKANPQKQSVSAQFRTSLTLLIEKMSACNPHFVRCLKPNPVKRPNAYDMEFVMRQLQYSGMLETTRIRKEGFPFRFSFQDFLDRYRSIAFSYTDKHVKPDRSCCHAVLKKGMALVARSPQDYDSPGLEGFQLGKNKVFLRYWHTPILDTLLRPQHKAAIVVQSLVRMFIQKRRYIHILAAYYEQLNKLDDFMLQLKNGITRVHRLNLVLNDEDVRRGTEALAQDVKSPKAMKVKAVDVKAVDVKAINKEAAKNKKEILKWWNKFERPKGHHVNDSGKVYGWFHGALSREEADEFLEGQPRGTFLVRISERFNGYALSFCFGDRVRHYRIGFSRNGGYQILGSSTDFGTMVELLEYYHGVPLSHADSDYLGEPLLLEHDLGIGQEQDLDAIANKKRNLQEIDDDTGGVRRDKRGRALRERSNSVRSLIELSDEDRTDGPGMSEAEYMDPPPRPIWLRGEMTRPESEMELERRGLRAGGFLVRPKVISPVRVVFVISVFTNRFRHFLVEKKRDHCWTIDTMPLPVSGTLNDLIKAFQKETPPRIGMRLERTPPALRPPVVRGTTGFLADSWDVDQVADWLRSISLGKYAETFVACGVNGLILSNLADSHIAYFMRNTHDCATVRNAIESMRVGQKGGPPSPRRSKDFIEVFEANEDFEFEDPVMMDPTQARPAAPGFVSPLSFRDENFKEETGLFKTRRPESLLKHACAKGDYRRVVELLYENPNMNVNAVRIGGSGCTPLFEAARCGHTQIVKLLLEHGANIDKRNFYGATPLDAATRNKHTGVLMALKSAQIRQRRAKQAESEAQHREKRRQYERDVGLLVTPNDEDLPMSSRPLPPPPGGPPPSTPPPLGSDDTYKSGGPAYVDFQSPHVYDQGSSRPEGKIEYEPVGDHPYVEPRIYPQDYAQPGTTPVPSHYG